MCLSYMLILGVGAVWTDSFNIQYNIYWNVWLGLSCRIIVDVRIVWKDSFDYTMHYLLECYVMIDLVG